MESDYPSSIDAVERMEALLRWIGIEPEEIKPREEIAIGKPMQSGAVKACICAARAVSICRRWANSISEKEREGVRRELAKKQEWYALAIWMRLNDPGS